jgi:hypothetical protein
MQTPIAESRVHSYQYFVRMVTRARAREFVKGVVDILRPPFDLNKSPSSGNAPSHGASYVVANCILVHPGSPCSRITPWCFAFLGAVMLGLLVLWCAKCQVLQDRK